MGAAQLEANADHVSGRGSAARCGGGGWGGPAWSSTPGGANRDDGDRCEDLPDYEEEQEAPETMLASQYADVDLLQVQTYFIKPTREGALSRWVAIVERNAEPLPE